MYIGAPYTYPFNIDINVTKVIPKDDAKDLYPH